MYQTETLSADSIEEIADEWNRLCDEGPCDDPFLRPAWFRSIIKSFGIDANVITVRRDNQLRAVLPLVSGRTALHGLRVRSLSGVFNLNTPRFGLVHCDDESERDAIIEQLWKAIDTLMDWDVFESRLVRNESWMDHLLNEANRHGSSAGIWQMDAAPFIDLTATEEFFSGSRKHFGKELARRARRLAELGSVEYVVTREYSEELIDRYLQLETMGWKGLGGTAAVQDKRAAELHQLFAREASSSGTLLAHELRLNDETIAMSLNITTEDVIFHWRTTYDDAYSRFAPGNLLFKQLVTDAREAGFREIDFLSPSTPNKRLWATGERGHAAYYIFRRGFLGRAYWIWKFVLMTGLRSLKTKRLNRN